MTGGPTSASTGSPLGRRSFIPGTPRFGRFIALLGGRLQVTWTLVVYVLSTGSWNTYARAWS